MLKEKMPIDKYLLITYYVVEIVLGNENTSVNGHNSLTSWKFILKKKRENTLDQKVIEHARR